MIIITRHARKRIQERTFLTEELVSKLLEAGVYKRIGDDYEGCQYLLFYSRIENMYFVVVFDPIKNTVITVLYDLGKKFCGSRVTRKHMKVAKNKWQPYVNKLGEEKNKADTERQCAGAEFLTAKIYVEVQLNGKREFIEELGELPIRSSSISYVLPAFHSELKIVVDKISSWLKTRSHGFRVNIAFYRKKGHKNKQEKMMTFTYETLCHKISEISSPTSQP